MSLVTSSKAYSGVTIVHFIITIIIISTCVLGQASCCSCAHSDLKSVFCSSDYAAIVTITGKNVYNSTSTFKSSHQHNRNTSNGLRSTITPLIVPLSTVTPYYYPLYGARSSSDSLNFASSQRSPSSRRFARHVFPFSRPIHDPFVPSFTSSRRSGPPLPLSISSSSSSSAPHRFHLIPARPLPRYPVDSMIASGSHHRAASSSKQIRKRLTSTNIGMHEREKLISQVSRTRPSAQSSPPARRTSYTFQLNNFIGPTSLQVKQIFSSNTLFVNERSSCFAPLKPSSKYVIWGRIGSSKSIHANLCNTIDFKDLTNDESVTVNSFLQGEQDCKRRRRWFNLMRKSLHIFCYFSFYITFPLSLAKFCTLVCD